MHPALKEKLIAMEGQRSERLLTFKTIYSIMKDERPLHIFSLKLFILYIYQYPNDDSRVLNFYVYLVGFTLTSTAKNWNK